MNHAQKALRLLADAVSDECVKSPAGFNASTLLTQRAQVQATLALVEQQRISNLVALASLQLHSGSGGVGDLLGDGAAYRALYPEGPVTPLAPEIAEALGLGAHQ